MMAIMGGGFYYQFKSDYPFVDPLIASVKKSQKIDNVSSTSYQCRLSNGEDTVYFDLELSGSNKAAIITGYAVRNNAVWEVKESNTEVAQTDQQ
ncbi:hypothetical protein [Hymenobacter volaticus]|uniref:Uncharacterized protein n=1 Tax=Hymenobacter volaticus TaxID=2932254 RepID=A0ABY4GAZ7_9BACT|nr:hypothetical protein [Hymenobacter volaticus]UOQ68083.1 hypothetical protein MUN86_09660 [Hymenobacter volaticus]